MLPANLADLFPAPAAENSHQPSNKNIFINFEIACGTAVISGDSSVPTTYGLFWKIAVICGQNKPGRAIGWLEILHRDVNHFEMSSIIYIYDESLNRISITFCTKNFNQYSYY